MRLKIWAALAIFVYSIIPASGLVELSSKYYNTLHEAIEAASGLSVDEPDIIYVLSDLVLHKPVIINSDKHIKLIAKGGDRIIARGSGNEDFPLFWITGKGASLSIGKPDMENELIICGGYLDSPLFKAHAPLVALNGPGSTLIMYGNTVLQNNCNISDIPGTGNYRNGTNTGFLSGSSIVIVVLSALAFAAVIALGFIWKKTLKNSSFNAGRTGNMLESKIDETGVHLTLREKEIVKLLLTDFSLQKIADTMKLSYSGVNFHTKNIYRKLEIQSRSELFVKFR